MSNKSKFLIILYVLIMAALLVVVYAIPKLTGALKTTVVVEYGALQVTDDVTCYAVRSEQVFLSGTAGTVNYYVSQDTQVRTGVRVMSITAGGGSSDEESPYAEIVSRLGANAVTTNDFTAPYNSCVSYYADGYESTFTPENIQALEHEEVKKIEFDVKNLTRESTRRGEPVYKLCDNSIWYLTTWVDIADSSKYQQGNSVTVRFGETEIPAKVYSIEAEEDKLQVTFETNRYYEDFSLIRKVDVTVVTSDYSGIIIPNESMIAEDSQVGVYVKDKTGEYNFTPIKIITSDGENSVVKVSTFVDEKGKIVETVKIYDEILKHPGKHADRK